MYAPLSTVGVARAARWLGRPRAYTCTKSGAHNIDCMRGGLGACPQEILLAVKCVLGAHFRASSPHIHVHTCKLSSSFNGFRSKSTRYGALASRLGSSHVHVHMCINLKFAPAAQMLRNNNIAKQTS